MQSISTDVLEGHTYCRYKAYLRLQDQHGIISDYQTVIGDVAADVGLKVHEKVIATCSDLVSTGIELTRNNLRKGPAFVFDAFIRDDGLLVHVNALKRISGASALGDFHYVPLLFSGHYQVRKEQRLLVESIGYILSGIQRRAPSHGIVHYGPNYESKSVQFRKKLQSGRIMLNDLREMQKDQALPRLLLNDHCGVCEFNNRCHTLAIEELNLSLIRGIRQRDVEKYGRKGILRLSQLAYTFRPRRSTVRATNHRDVPLQAKAVLDRTVYVLGSVEVPSPTVSIYLDIEANPFSGFVYLIGMIVCNGGQEDRFSLWAHTREDELKIFDQFLAIYSRYEAPLVFCYGAYEKQFLQRMQRKAQYAEAAGQVLRSLVNILSIIYSHFYFPTYSNSLKEIGRFLGSAWDDEKSSGIQSIVWHTFWSKTRDEHWRTKLIDYNMEDCSALRDVTRFLRTACSGATTSVPETTRRSPVVVNARQIGRAAYDAKWSSPHLEQHDLEFVRTHAHFDYQRKRVYVRTNKTIRNHQRKMSRKKVPQPRVSQHVDVQASECPKCDGVNLATAYRSQTARTRKKRAFDLLITSGTTKRVVIEYHTKVQLCLACGHHFVPEQYQHIAKFHHNLVSWATYNHIAHRLSSRSIADQLYELFNLRVGKTDIHMFKTVMAQRYRPTYDELLSKLISGSVIHVDETEVKLRSGKAYVWVFTSLEAVIYVLRPDRTGGFLHEILGGFSGVLVSDFYAAYDSVPCAQQRCLIHLIRDMNQEILSHPFDTELRLITGRFGSLLRSIVGTVDRHGLKQAKLTPYRRKIAKFFDGIQEEPFRSEVANALRERLVKNRTRLFTFTEYDGVPWNNNNAEYAIKTFAQYRDEAAGVFKESGLADYLILLSIFQTCRYKGVSFFKFRLSEEESLDRFCGQSGPRRRSRQIEVLPSGFDPTEVSDADSKEATLQRTAREKMHCEPNGGATG